MSAASSSPEPPDRRWWVLLAVGVGTFMSALDGSVVNTVLPLMRIELHTTVASVEWVTTIYLLVVSGILLGVGRAGDLYGHKRSYVGGFFLFVGGSALCGLAPSVGWLVGLRALQALGAAMLFANSPAILTKAFPAEQRGKALGAQATMTYLGLTVGPPLGGWLADAFGWRWVFYINVPVGAIAILLAWKVIRADRPEHAMEPFDWGGAALFTAGLTALLLALNQGHAWGWASLPVIALLGAAVLLLVLFVRRERSTPSPMLDLGLFRSGLFTSATNTAVLLYICTYSVVFVLPFLLVQGRGLSTAQAGLVLTAQPVVMALVAPVSGTLSDRVGVRIPRIAGMVALTGGLLFLARAAGSPDTAGVAAGLAVVGLGVGIFVSPNNSALMGAAPLDRQGIASGVLATARNAGMVLGVGITGAVYTTILAHSGARTAAVVHGTQTSLLVAAGVAAIGAVIAMVR